MFGFLFGALAGGVAAYVWRDRIRSYLNQRMPDMREKAAEKLGAVGKGAEDMLDRAKSTLWSNLRAGQQRLRSTSGASGTSGTAGSPGTETGSRAGDER